MLLNKSQRVVLFIVLTLVLPLLLYYYTSIQRVPFVSKYTLLADVNDTRPSSSTGVPKYILLYDSFFYEPHWDLPTETAGHEYLNQLGCPVTNCVITSDRSLVRPITAYDAIVFHIAQPWNHQAPRWRSAKQIYVAGCLESPMNTNYPLALAGSFFNWTMSYRLDSDVLWSYNNFVDLKTAQVMTPGYTPGWRNDFLGYRNETLLKLFHRKTKIAAQFASNCDASSNRQALVRRLQAEVPVDVYGDCGTLTCPKGSERCGQMLDERYFFYLSFENSLCVDYVTEKLYNALGRFVVPVVFGGADYDRFAPPHSYIDVRRFRNVPELARYLRRLVNNPVEYVEYFWWKERYGLRRIDKYCALCQNLHRIGARTRVQYYRDIEAWWNDGACTSDTHIDF